MKQRHAKIGTFKNCERHARPEASSSVLMSLIDRFRRDESGNFGMIAAILIVPLLLVVMLAMDSANLMRTHNNVQMALDASALAVGKRFSTGAGTADMETYGRNIFNTNLTALTPDKVIFKLQFPDNANSNQQIEASANFQYKSLFGNLSSVLSYGKEDWNKYFYTLKSYVKLKNTIEVALVLDNSGSMTEKGTGSSTERMTLLKQASIQLVETLAAQSSLIKNVEKPVQFSLVPFAGSVNVGPTNANAAWIDKDGLSAVHYENFTLPTASSPITVASDKLIVLRDNKPYKQGKGWGTDDGKLITRLSLFDDLQIYTNSSAKTTKSFASWKGCVESRPGELALNNSAPTTSKPDSLFVPMFGPDEYDDRVSGKTQIRAHNNWWVDSSDVSGYLGKQKDLKKYFMPAPYDVANRSTENASPNYSCTTPPITPLTDVSTPDGVTKIKAAINAMTPGGATNVPEGLAWGWRTVSSSAPFAGGRPESERGNDKVVIVLTDGANTYYRYNTIRPENSSNASAVDNASDISYYSAYGYTSVKTKGYTQPRIFHNTTQSSNTNETNSDYSKAMNTQFSKLCDNAKKGNIMIMTVALDLNANNADDKAQITALTNCSSDSRVRRDANDPSKPAKLFWNSKGGDLSETFRQIGDELSNLRIVG